MARLIFNADDFGLSHGVNKGIVHAYKKGVLNSTSLMTTVPYFEEAVALIHKHQLENIGLHFNLTEYTAALDHQTLTNEKNEFYRNVHEKQDLNLEEVYRELEAQYMLAIKAGVIINHIDSHHHVHMTVQLRKVFIEFSKKYHLPLRRLKNTARNPVNIFKFYKDTLAAKFYTKDFTADFYDERATEENLLKILHQYQGNDLEIMCHPGYKDVENGIYDEQREKELKILCSDNIINLVKNVNL